MIVLSIGIIFQCFTVVHRTPTFREFQKASRDSKTNSEYQLITEKLLSIQKTSFCSKNDVLKQL